MKKRQRNYRPGNRQPETSGNQETGTGDQDGDGKISVVVVERDSLTYYKEVKAPTMILRSDDFGRCLTPP